MEVILREDWESLGRRGDVVKVAEGYARNFLLPKGKALAVTPQNKARIEKERKDNAIKAGHCDPDTRERSEDVGSPEREMEEQKGKWEPDCSKKDVALSEEPMRNEAGECKGDGSNERSEARQSKDAEECVLKHAGEKRVPDQEQLKPIRSQLGAESC